MKNVCLSLIALMCFGCSSTQKSPFISVNDVTDEREDAIYSTRPNKNGDLETDGDDFFQVPEHWRNIND